MSLRAWIVSFTIILLGFTGAAGAEPPRVELRRAYLEYSSLKRSMAVVEENRLLLQSISDIAEARFRTGHGNQQDVLCAQLETLRLMERQVELEKRVQAAGARIDRLLGRPPGTAVNAPPETAKRTRLAYSLDQLRKMAAESSAKRRGGDAFQYDLERAHAEASTSERLVELQEKNIIPLAKVALESAFSAYQNGTGDFQTLREIYLTLTESRLGLEEALAAYGGAVAEMESLTGVEITKETVDESK
ncbi:MAG: TolC family protein [Acidobacteriota bacterium]